MNFLHLSDDELLRHLDKHSEDPLILRLVDILMNKQHGIISDLVAAGMDPQDWTFCADSYNRYYPGQYVTHLHSEVDYYKDELEASQYALEQSEQELKNLKARTVLEWVDELKEQVQRSDYGRDQARQERDSARISEQDTKNKLKMWRALSENTAQSYGN